MADITPHTLYHVRLVGHHDLGTIRARWVVCILELEDGARYGPYAIYECRPVPNAGEILRWKHVHPGSATWLLVGSVGGKERTIAALGGENGMIDELDNRGIKATGLIGKEWIVEALLDAGWTCGEGFDPDTQGPEALRDLSGRAVIMSDGTERVVATDHPNGVLFADDKWIRRVAAGSQIAHVVAPDDSDNPTDSNDFPF